MNAAKLNRLAAELNRAGIETPEINISECPDSEDHEIILKNDLSLQIESKYGNEICLCRIDEEGIFFLFETKNIPSLIIKIHAELLEAK